MAIRVRASPLWAAEGMSSGPSGSSRRFPRRTATERIQAATATAIAATGYEQTTVEAIRSIAEVSPEVFDECFSDKAKEAVLAVEAASDQAMGECRLLAAAASSWPESIWAVLTVLTDWGVCEPAFAQLALVEVAKAGPEAVELMDSLIDTFGLFLSGGYRHARPQPLPVGSLDFEIGAEALAVAHRHVLYESPETLPTIRSELAKVVLSPFLGADEAERLIAEWVSAA